jgi:small subunit ribosomal protein S5
MSYNAIDDSQEKYFEKLIKINRVTKVNKGGKKLAFRAFVIVGDQKGRVGLATAKSKEVPLAIRRSIDKAKKQMHDINLSQGTIPHEIVGHYKASSVVLRPAPDGTGVIAGGSIRILLESLGVENIVAKSIGSSNSLNMAKAALDGLLKLKNLADVEARRGVKISRSFLKKERVGDNNDSSAS